MANNQRGKRGGSVFNRSVKLAAQSMLDTGSTSGVVANGKKGYSPAMNAHFDGEEKTEDFLLPALVHMGGLRRSITVKQGLEYKPLQMEFEDRNGKQLDKVTKKLVAVNERRLVWKSDRSLLNRTKVDDPYKKFTGIKRLTSNSKRIVHDQPTPEPLANSVISLHGKNPINDDTL